MRLFIREASRLERKQLCPTKECNLVLQAVTPVCATSATPRRSIEGLFGESPFEGFNKFGGSRRSVSIATPQAARGTDCPRRGVQYLLHRVETEWPSPSYRSRAFNAANILFRHRRKHPRQFEPVTFRL